MINSCSLEFPNETPAPNKGKHLVKNNWNWKYLTGNIIFCISSKYMRILFSCFQGTRYKSKHAMYNTNGSIIAKQAYYRS